MDVATSPRKRKPKPVTAHLAGSPEAVAGVRVFVRQEARLRARRGELRSIERERQRAEKRHALQGFPAGTSSLRKQKLDQ